ncbi:hypothetical protein HK103_006576 [Boothiomyces macroporosus]|uniref:Uncharacterized protein n=1 Tax=Boothiomyces macroporosus TaxID=261099 RepID=A0AAD5UEC9_9FUNG|nr:hypothetical protein HK103_006576 [Boothiomyces macroporosus]
MFSCFGLFSNQKQIQPAPNDAATPHMQPLLEYEATISQLQAQVKLNEQNMELLNKENLEQQETIDRLQKQSDLYKYSRDAARLHARNQEKEIQKLKALVEEFKQEYNATGQVFQELQAQIVQLQTKLSLNKNIRVVEKGDSVAVYTREGVRMVPIKIQSPVNNRWIEFNGKRHKQLKKDGLVDKYGIPRNPA